MIRLYQPLHEELSAEFEWTAGHEPKQPMVIFWMEFADLSDFWELEGDEPVGESIRYQIPQIFLVLKHAYLIYNSSTRWEGYTNLMSQELQIFLILWGEGGKNWVLVGQFFTKFTNSFLDLKTNI